MGYANRHPYSSAFFIVAAAFVMYALSAGFRAIFGILIHPVMELTGVSYEQAGLAFGVAQLLYGASQPVWGILALRKSNGLVLFLGALLMGLGLAGMALFQGLVSLTLFLGFMVGSGAGALCFGMIMGLISPLLGSQKASAVSGIINASGGIGSAVLSPVYQFLIISWGARPALLTGTAAFALLLPVIFWLGRKEKQAQSGEQSQQEEVPTGTLFKNAVKTWNYKALMIGFSTCGFHMIIIQTHLVPQMISLGIPAQTAALIYTGYGITTMAGAVLSGLLCLRFPKQRVLGSLYGARVLTVGLFMFLLPKTLPFLAAYALCLGFTGDATVTPTSELVKAFFGAKAMGFLFGVTFLCHQVGAFVSSYLGGVVFTATGSYEPLWLADMGLCLLASVVSYKISSR